MDILNLFKKGMSTPPAPTVAVYRFYLQPGESKRVIFLNNEEETLSTYEHTLYDGVKRYYAVCLKMAGLNCYLCEQKVPRSWVTYATVIDIDGFVGRDNRKYQYVKRLYVLKKQALERFIAKLGKIRKKVPNFNLKYAEFEITRSDLGNSPASGDDFDYLKTWSEEELKDLVVKGYVKDLKLIDPAQVVKVFTSYDESKLYYESIVPPGFGEEPEGPEGDIDDEIEF